MAAKKIFENLYFIPGPTNTGVIVDKADDLIQVYLIDSGMNDEDAERIWTELETLFPSDQGGFSLKAIINTHSHADHAGGNNWFVNKTECDIWISYGEAGSLMNPALQSIVTSGGHPLSQVDTPYLHAKECVATRIIGPNDVIKLNNSLQIGFIRLPGHYLDMLGIVVTSKDNSTALFSGDAFFGQGHILKYWIPFLFDVRKFKETLEMLSQSNYNFYIPSHGTLITEISETAELNTIAILSTETCILNELKKEELTKEELLKKVADKNDLIFRIGQHQLINCTLNAYLTYLAEEKKIDCKIVENRLIWYAL